MGDVKLYDTQQAERYLHSKGLLITRRTLQAWCKRKKIAAIVLPSGTYRIPEESLDALFKLDGEN